jgi:hypothetical protein
MKAIIVETSTDVIDGEMRTELLDWARGLGLDTKRATTQFVLTEGADGAWKAHFSLKRQRDGHDYIVPGTGRAATDFNAAVFEVAEGSWPRWFGQPEDLPLVRIAALMECLAIAASQGNELQQAARRRREGAAV